MKHVAKAIIIDDHGHYLLLKRSGHPTFPNDPDLPGGIVETGESLVEGLVREVVEETGIVLSTETIQHSYTDTAAQYSTTTTYHLYTTQLAQRPQVTISWEHASYAWVSPEEFMRQAQHAADSYMHMVYDATV